MALYVKEEVAKYALAYASLHDRAGQIIELREKRDPMYMEAVRIAHEDLEAYRDVVPQEIRLQIERTDNRHGGVLEQLPSLIREALQPEPAQR